MLPPWARGAMTFTPQQEQELAELEQEVRAKMDAILTPQQRKRLEESTGRAHAGLHPAYFLDMVKYHLFPNHHPWWGEMMPWWYAVSM